MTCVGGPNGDPIIPDNTSGGLIAKQSNTIQPYQYVQPFFPTYNTPQDTLTLNTVWSAPILGAFGLAVDASVRLNFTLTPIGGLATLRQQEQFTRLDTIKAIATVSGKTAITFNNVYTPVTAGGQWQTELTSIEVVDSISTAVVGTADYQNLWANSTMLLLGANVAALQTAGLIGDITGLTAGQAVPVGNTKFNLHCQTLLIDGTTAAAIPVEVWQDTWIAPDVPTSRQLVSNRSIAMPIQGATTQ
jgi:hypothetical protein